MFSSKYSTDITELCRFCAQLISRTTLISFTENEEEFRNCLNILEFLNVRYVDLSPGNNLPKTICDSCYRSLTDAYEFFKKVLKSQTDLSEICVAATVKIEVIDEVETFYFPEYTTAEPHAEPQKRTITSKSSYSNRHCTIIEDKEISSESESDNDDELVYAGVPVFIERIPLDQDNTDNYTSDSGSEIEFTYAGYPVFDHQDKSWAHYIWRCSHCQDGFDTLMSLRSHSMNAHNTCFAYECEDCDDDSKVFDEFIEHMRSHRDNLRYYCKYCDHYNDTIDECLQHEKNHNEHFHACISCGELFEDAFSLARHKKKALPSKLNENIDKSEDSDDSLSSVEEPINAGGIKIPTPDYQIETWKDYPWICPICQLAFLSIDQWRAHGRSKHGKCASYKCFDCKGYRCKKLRHLIAHIRKHRSNLSLQCQFCYEVKTNEDALRKHIAGHLQNYFWCDFCGEKFEDSEGLETHLRKFRKKIHIKRTTPLTTEELTCKVCGKIAKTQRALTVHVRIHGENNYACEVCGQTFNSKSNLGIHLSRHYKRFICDLCDKAFPTRIHIIRHIETHDTKPFACQKCGYTTRTKVALRRHQIKHSTVLPFVCQICNKAFKTKLYLRKHSLQHTGEKPYLCKFCHKAFANTSNCHKHMKRIHKEFRLLTKPRSVLDINIT